MPTLRVADEHDARLAARRAGFVQFLLDTLTTITGDPDLSTLHCWAAEHPLTWAEVSACVLLGAPLSPREALPAEIVEFWELLTFVSHDGAVVSGYAPPPPPLGAGA